MPTSMHVYKEIAERHGVNPPPAKPSTAFIITTSPHFLKKNSSRSRKNSMIEKGSRLTHGTSLAFGAISYPQARHSSRD